MDTSFDVDLSSLDVLSSFNALYSRADPPTNPLQVLDKGTPPSAAVGLVFNTPNNSMYIMLLV